MEEQPGLGGMVLSLEGMKGNPCQDGEQNQCWGRLGGFWVRYGSCHKSRAGMRGWSQRVASAECSPPFVLIAGLYLAAEVSINRALLHGNAVERQRLCRRGLQGCKSAVPSLPGPLTSSPGGMDPALWLEQVREEGLDLQPSFLMISRP